jgi:hypothetical protein
MARFDQPIEPMTLGNMRELRTKSFSSADDGPSSGSGSPSTTKVVQKAGLSTRASFVASASLCGVAEDDPQRIEWSNGASHKARRSALFANDLDQHALAAPSVELAIKNLLPRTEVEFTRRDRDHNLPPHNLAFHMGIGIVLAGSVVTVA